MSDKTDIKLGKITQLLYDLPIDKRNATAELLVKLGIVPEAIVKAGMNKINKSFIKSPKKKAVEEYNLVAIIKCKTCNTIREQWFKMAWDEERTALIAIHLSIKPEEFRVLNATDNRCKLCNMILNEMSKEELIEKIMELSCKLYPL